MARRRQKGEGSIVEYRKGHFRGFLDLGRDPKTNKRIRKTFTGSSKAEVVAKLNKAKYEKQEGILKITNRTPLRLYMKHWLSVRSPSIRESTQATYERLMSLHILPVLGDKSIADITLIDLNEAFSFIELNNSTKNTIKVILSNVFKLAVKEQLIRTNPVSLMDTIKFSQKEIKALTVDEVHKLLATAKDFSPFYYWLIRVAIETGLRKGELLALHWSDIDFAKDTISVKRTVDAVGHVGEPKTAKSKRTLSVSKETLEGLQVLRRPDCDIVFSNASGDYKRASPLQYAFTTILKKAGLRHIRFHDLRHTNATLLIAKGINMKTVSERLGHSSITITMDRYTHGILEEDKKAAKVIDGLIDV